VLFPFRNNINLNGTKKMEKKTVWAIVATVLILLSAIVITCVQLPATLFVIATLLSIFWIFVYTRKSKVERKLKKTLASVFAVFTIASLIYFWNPIMDHTFVWKYSFSQKNKEEEKKSGTPSNTLVDSIKNQNSQSGQNLTSDEVSPDPASVIKALDDTARSQFERMKQSLIDKATAARKRYNDSVTASNNSCKLNDSIGRAWAGLEDEVLAKINKDMPKVQLSTNCHIANDPPKDNHRSRKEGKAGNRKNKRNIGDYCSNDRLPKGYKRIKY